MTSLVSRGPVVDMTTPSLGNRLNSYVTRGKTRILYGFLLARPYFFKTLRVFFSQGKKHSSSDPRARDRYGDPCTPSNKITPYVKGSFIELFSC